MRINFRYLPVYLPMLISLSLSAAEPEYRWVGPKKGLNLREDADPKGKMITTIPFGEKVQVLEQKPDAIEISGVSGYWTKVTWKGKTGWVFGGFLLWEDFQRLAKKNLSQFKSGCLSEAVAAMPSCGSCGTANFKADGKFSSVDGRCGGSEEGTWKIKGDKILAETCAGANCTKFEYTVDDSSDFYENGSKKGKMYYLKN